MVVDKEEALRRIQAGRDFIKPYTYDEGFMTDWELKLPRPLLYKEPMRETSIPLPLSFEELPIERDFLRIINSRVSSRDFTQEKMTLLELSYLLWVMQGVKSVRGHNFVTFRTVPSGGSRHPFEVYMTVRNVEGLADGYYHYLPEYHRIELLREENDPELLEAFIAASARDQKWAAKANIVFYFSFMCYRAEWRYSFYAHRAVLIDAGHLAENLYLAVTSIGRGGCAVGKIDMKLINETFELDEEEEYVFYSMPVGTIEQQEGNTEDTYSYVRNH